MVIGMADREIGEYGGEGVAVCPEGRPCVLGSLHIGGVWGHGQGGCNSFCRLSSEGGDNVGPPGGCIRVNEL